MKNNIIISTVIGLFLSSAIMYIAWQQNAQYEIYEGDVIDFSYLISIGASWFILGFMCMLLFIIVLKKITNIF